MLPFEYRNKYFAVGILLSCHRALTDAKSGISSLREKSHSEDTILSSWKVEYAGICALLRASVHLIGVDAKACHNEAVKRELSAEWQAIKEEKNKHEIYWEFINKERNSILKDYQWSSYTEYLDETGGVIEAKDLSLLTVVFKSRSSVLKINSGAFKGRETLGVLDDAAVWVEARIVGALSRAGFSLDDQIQFQTWTKKPIVEGLLASPRE